MIKKLIISIVAIGLIVLAVVKLAHNKAEINRQTTYKEIVSNVPVKVITAQQVSLDDPLNFVGVFKPSREATVSAEIAGKIVRVFVEEGSFVHEGQVIAELDTTLLELQLQTDEAQFVHSQEDLARYENLIKRDATTDVTLKQARLTNKLNEIAVKNTKERIIKSTIKAPISGFLSSKNFEDGTVVSAGVSIAEIVNVNILKFTASVPEYQVVKLVPGQKVMLNADVYPNIQFTGTITQIAEKGDENHTYKVEVTVSNDKNGSPLRATMNGTVKAEGNTKSTGIFIPREALTGTTDKPQVYLAISGKAQLKDVSTGRAIGNMIQIATGLTVGDKIIVSGLNNIKNGVSISIADAN